MSMILCLSTLSDENVAKVLADPPLIWRVLAPDDPEAYERARDEVVKSTGSWWKRMLGKRAREVAEPLEFSLLSGEVESTDLDKAWHGIHFMLTQSAWEGEWPLNFLVSGGREVGEIDVGYGAARAMTAAEVKTIAAALQDVDEPFMRERFNPETMMRLDIYPTIWDRDPSEDDSFGYCMEYLNVLKEFIVSAANRNFGLIVSLS